MIEFTDRYGGNMPSGLRGCHDCDAMGVSPRMIPVPGVDPKEISAEHTWDFVTCESCHGTARVSWFATAARVPGWFFKSIRFTFIEAPRFHAGEPRYVGWKQGFKCSFLADLGLWRP